MTPTIQYKRLGDLFLFRNGRGFRKEEWSTRGLPIIRIQNLNSKDASFNYFAGEYSQDILIEPGDLLFSWSGTVGSSFGPHLWNGNTGLLNQHIFKIGLRDTVIKRYAFYGLRYITEEIEQSVHGAVGLVHITKEKLNEFKLRVSPVAEQQRIVDILDETFEGIATAKAKIENNLENARAVFHSYIQSVFTQRREGWVEKRLEEVVDATCTLSYGIVQPGDEFPNGLPVVRPTDLTTKEIRLDGLKRIDPRLADSCRRTEVHGREILLCVRGSTGAVSIATNELAGANVTRGIVPIRFNQLLLTQDFGYYVMSSGEIQRQIREKTYGAALMQINIRDLRNVTLSFPPLKEQNPIVVKLDILWVETKRLESIYERKLAALDALKKSLLQQAFSGELTGKTGKSVTIPFSVRIPDTSPTDLHAGILAIAYELHEKNGRQNYFGHVKSEKIAHMVEASLGIDLGRCPVKDVAGPSDFPHLSRVEYRATKKNYFNFKRVNGAAYRVQKLAGFQRLVDQTRIVLGDRRDEVERLLQWMLPMTTQQSEIVTTVFSAWNNLLLEGKLPTDEQIVFEARENWHADKLKIDRDKFFTAVQWLRKQGRVPEGKGKRVESKGKVN